MNKYKIFRILKVILFEIIRLLNCYLSIIGLMFTCSLFITKRNLDEIVSISKVSLMELTEMYNKIFSSIFLITLVLFIFVRYVLNKKHIEILKYIKG